MELNNILLVAVILILFLVEGLFEVTILSSIGALVRTAFSSKKFKTLYREQPKFNSVVGVLALIVLFIFVFGLVKLF